MVCCAVIQNTLFAHSHAEAHTHSYYQTCHQCEVYSSMNGQVAQETLVQRQMEQLVNTTNKMPALDNTAIVVCTSPRVLWMKNYAGFVTGKMTPEEKGRKRLKKGKRFSLKSSFTANQSFEMVPGNEDKYPEFKAVQESSACTSKVPPWPECRCPPSNGDLNLPPVKRSGGN